ncbi:MAG: hypothetical protein K1X89_01890 [Myxococcaceae bacterium]|nr:hypothetical protein [Myxococcaceae bacterium]
MKIVVNHLTRMAPGYICVAGIDPATERHVRPVLLGARLTRALLKNEGGPFSLGAVVDLGDVEPNGSAPEVEDHLFEAPNAKSTSAMKPSAFWKLLKSVAAPNLKAIFGKALKPNSSSMAVDLGEGTASLGCFHPSGSVSIEIDSRYDSVKLRFKDGGTELLVGVTDLRLFEKDQKTPNRKAIDNINRRLRAGVPCILSVGLSRAFVKKYDTEKRHYLQVNNLHLEDDPCWSG